MNNDFDKKKEERMPVSDGVSKEYMEETSKENKDHMGDFMKDYLESFDNDKETIDSNDPSYKRQLTLMNPIADVREFHTLFNHPIVDTPSIPSDKRCVLRMNLLTEELKELQQAIYDGDIVEIADAFADLQYVLSGAILEFGMGDVFAKVFAEVQRSNMSKACKDTDELKATIDKYEPIEGPCNYYPKVLDSGEEVYIVERDSDNKTLKSVGYSPADLSFIKQ